MMPRRNDPTNSDKRIRERLSVIPLPQEESLYPDTALEDTLTLYADFPTQLSFPAAHKSASLPFQSGMDGLSFVEQETWIFPVIRDQGKRRKLNSQISGAKNYASNLRKLIRSSGIYAVSSMASPLISLLLAPFLTHNLTHTEYGALAVLNTTVALMAGITQLGLNSAFFRSYNFDYESKRDRLDVLSTLVILLSLISIPVATTMIIAAPWLAVFLLGSSSYTDPVRLAGVAVLMQNLSVPGTAWLRAENRAAFYAILSIANLLTSLGITIILVGVVGIGIAGSLIAVAMGYAVVVFIMLPLIVIRAGIHLRVDIAKGLLSFGLPNVSNFVSVWILQLSDRYLLAHLGSLSETASYAVAYSLGGALSAIVIAPFMLAWPTTMYSIAKKDNAAPIFQLVFRWFSIVLLLAAFSLSLIGTVFLDLLFPLKYQSAAPIIPIIATSTMFYGIYYLCTIGISIKRKTWFAVAFTTTSALVNVGLNLVLIPRYGAMGAAAATLIAYIVLALAAYIVNQRIYPIPFEIGRFTLAFLIGVALYVGSDYLVQSQGIYVTYGTYLGALALYGGCLVLIGKVPTRSQRAPAVGKAGLENVR